MAKRASWTRRLKIRHLEIFVMLVETGNQSVAAGRLNITQPALSKWLRELEEDIGASLFERGKSLTLTPLGTEFLAFAEQVLGEAKNISYVLKDIHEGRAGRLRIGVLHAVVSDLLPTAILKIREAAPLVKISVQENTLSPLLEALHRRELDLVIGRIQGAELAGIQTEVLYAEQVTAVVRANHPLCAETHPSWAKATKFPWIASHTGTPMRIRLEAELVNAEVPFPADVLESRSVVVNDTLLRTSDMITLMSRNVANFYTRKGDVVELNLPMTGNLGPVGVFLPEANLSPIVTRFLDIVREISRELTTPK